MRSNRRRVILLLPYINSYRVPLLVGVREVLAASGVIFDVFAAKATGADARRSDSAAFDSLPVRQLHLKVAGKSLHLRSLPTGWFSADLLILEHAVKNLESFMMLAIRRAFGRRTILWGHGSTITKKPTFLTRAGQRWMVEMASGYFAYTEGSALRAQKLGAHPDSTIVLRNTIDTAPLQAKSISDVSRRPAVLLYVGGLDASKRVTRLLRVGARVASRVEGFRLIVGGRGESEHLFSNSTAPWLDYRGVMGTREKVLAGAEASAMIITGRVGLAVVDAFALGIPVITTEWAYHAPEFEYLNDGNSIVVDDSEDALVDAIVAFMADTEGQQFLQSGARQSVGELSINSMISRYVDGVLDAIS